MGISDVVSFLSIIPAGGRSLEGAAASQHWFPAVGLIIGGVGGVACWLASFVVEPLIAAVAAVAAISVLTGLHHTDGLADFADGLMGRGDAKRRLAIMRDKVVGAGGVTAVALCTICAVAAISHKSGADALVVIVVSEVAAKYSMVVVSHIGRPAAAGSGAAFCGRANKRSMLAATAWWLAPAIALLAGITVWQGGWQYAWQAAGLLVWPVVAASLIAVAITATARRALGGVTGDVMGAANDVGRAGALVVAVSL